MSNLVRQECGLGGLQPDERGQVPNVNSKDGLVRAGGKLDAAITAKGRCFSIDPCRRILRREVEMDGAAFGRAKARAGQDKTCASRAAAFEVVA